MVASNSRNEQMSEYTIVYRYKYKWRYLQYGWIATMFPFAVALSAGCAREYGIWVGAAFCIGVNGFVFGAAFFLLLSLADIEVDEGGISRRAIAWRWQHLFWSDIIQLTISPSINPETGVAVRALGFTGRPGSSGCLTRRILFQERLPAMRQLLDEIDREEFAHRLPIRDLSKD